MNKLGVKFLCNVIILVFALHNCNPYVDSNAHKIFAVPCLHQVLLNLKLSRVQAFCCRFRICRFWKPSCVVDKSSTETSIILTLIYILTIGVLLYSLSVVLLLLYSGDWNSYTSDPVNVDTSSRTYIEQYSLFNSSPLKCCVCWLKWLSDHIITCSGDIELNPGPILYSLNVCSLRNKVDLLFANIQTEVDMLCLTETKIDNTVPDSDVILPGFTSIFRKDLRHNSGGICVQLSNALSGKRLHDFEYNDLELMWVKVSSGNIELILGVCYRNPALPVAYWERLTENLSEIVASFDHNKIVLVGDFNDDLLNPNKHHLKDIINHFSFHQLVDTPTRSTHNTNTLLDPIIVGDQNLFNNVTVLPPNCSDHNPILAKIEPCITRSSHKRKIRLYKHANWTSLKRDLSNHNWNELTTLSLDDAVEYFNSFLITKCDQYIPLKSVRFSSKDKAWITGEIKIEMDVRDKLFKKAKRSGLFQDFETFKQQRNYVNDLIRVAKKIILQILPTN